MLKIRLVPLGLLVAFAMSVAMSASASANTWQIEKSGGGTETLKTTETFNEEATVGISRIKFHLNEIEVKCTGVNVRNGHIKKANENDAESIIFTGCTVLKPSPGCSVEGGEIKTEPVESTLSEKGLPLVEFKPKPPSTKFATFKLTGAGCGVLAGAYTVKGTTKGEVLNATQCDKVHTLKIKEEPSTLTVAGEAVGSFEQEVGLSLKSGKCFAAK